MMSESINEAAVKDSVKAESYHESNEDAANDAAANSHCSNTTETPNATWYWIPNVPSSEKPAEGMVFGSFEDAKKMYEGYADKAGFVPRLSTVKKSKGEVTHRYIVCNKSGKPGNKESTVYGISKKPGNIKVTGCSACVKFKVIPGTSSYRVYEFVEPHNHELLEAENKDLTRVKRQLQCRKQLMSNSNFRRDVSDFVGEADAQMLVDRLNKAKRSLPNFSFEYDCVDGELAFLFWADEIAKINYDAFGDVLAIGVTYGTNKYKMIFVSFTGFDHHKKCITFGGALLSSETTESYNLLLQSFLKAHVKQPQLVLTDEDDDIKEAIALTLPQSTHWLCMWHIMDKLPHKICRDILEDTDLSKRLHKLVRNTYIAVTEFEESWHKLVVEYELDENEWLRDMFEIRERWIPVYFKDIPMCCITKITSRADSFFRVDSHPNNSLVHFIMCFENAMEAQRLNQRQLDHVTNTTTPTWLTHLSIERYAANVYTRSLFTEVQKEIWKCVMSCTRMSVVSENGCEVHVIMENRSTFTAEFKVVRNLEDHIMVCSCLKMVQVGYLCRHIFFVLRILGVHEISDQYVLRRWKRDAVPAGILKKQRYGSVDDQSDALMSKARLLWGPA